MASSSARSWEGWGDAAPLAPDDPVAGGWGEASFGAHEIDYDNISSDVAESEFYSLLVELKLTGVLTAKQCCIIAFWATKAGARGDANRLSVKPSAQSGKFSHRFDAVVGKLPDECPLYGLPLSRRIRHSAVKVWEPIPVRLPLEALADEVDRSLTELVAALGRARSDGDLPLCYTEDPVVRDADPDVPVFPASIYIDGVSFSRTDSCLGVWIHISLSNERHLLAVFRRTEVCGCGCKGWCSLGPLWACIAWSIIHLRQGIHPTHRHDGTEFGEDEAWRRTLAGKSLGFKAVVIVLKSDISEYSHSMGLPSTNDSVSPCLFCFSSLDDFFSTAALTPSACGFPTKELHHYDRACRNCEISLVINMEARRLIGPHLVYVKSKNAIAGRVLNDDIPSLALLKGDRLEPSPGLWNVDAFEETAVPFRATFWRRSAETLARHRNPMISASTGITPKHIGIDWMHTISLGIAQLALGFFLGLHRLQHLFCTWWSDCYSRADSNQVSRRTGHLV